MGQEPALRPTERPGMPNGLHSVSQGCQWLTVVGRCQAGRDVLPWPTTFDPGDVLERTGLAERGFKRCGAIGKRPTRHAARGDEDQLAIDHMTHRSTLSDLLVARGPGDDAIEGARGATSTSRDRYAPRRSSPGDPRSRPSPEAGPRGVPRGAGDRSGRWLGSGRRAAAHGLCVGLGQR